jgi:hypothetical protein
MHATIKRPYVVDGKIEIRPIMVLAHAAFKLLVLVYEAFSYYCMRP